ncbi:DUF4271 domain-containing protein [uncultured Winogradskyella sp.]|uniref:DUF4271 domain-containing protein n=1 Tax=uncultured Winogradskyella sp. TaxID=395353 RepID=UPI0026311967|nr:DUF4271 domain-containing protein [uncultured Winogradskyella sp.]
MRQFITYDWFTVLSLFSLIAIIAAKTINSIRFNDFLYTVGNSKYLKIYSKDQKFIDLFDGFLFINLVVSASIFLYQGYSNFIVPVNFEIITFFKLAFTLATIIIIKTLIERLIGSLFEIDGLIDFYLFQKTTFINYSGFVLLAANIILLYTNINTKIIVITAFILVVLLNLIGFITSFKIYQKSLLPNLFYFLLYLCALEIAPYVLLYKAFRGYNV